MSVSISLLGDPCAAASAHAEISGPGMASLGPVPLQVSDGVVSGTIPSVPSGLNRRVEVTVLNAQGARVYSGAIVVDVVEGREIQASITLSRDEVNCPSTGTVVVTGTVDGTWNAVDGGIGSTGVLLAGPGLAFDFTDAHLSSDGVLHFFVPAADQVRRLDLAAQDALPAVTGSLDAVSMAVSPGGEKLYLGYTGGRIEEFDYAAQTVRLLAVAPETPSTLLVAGDNLFTVDASGAWDTQSLFDRATGARLDHEEWSYSIRSIVYSSALQRVFYLDSGVSPTDIHMRTVADDTLSADEDSPYHGDYLLPSPIRLLPDESGVIVGSGQIFDAADLRYRGSVGLAFEDVAFHQSRLYLIDTVGENTQVRALDAAYEIVAAGYFPGTARRVFVWNEQLVLITARGGATEVRLLPL